MSKASKLLEELSVSYNPYYKSNINEYNSELNDINDIEESTYLYTFASDISFDFDGTDKYGEKYTWIDLSLNDAIKIDKHIIDHTKKLLRNTEIYAQIYLNKFCNNNGIPKCNFVGFKLDKNNGLVTTLAFNEPIVSNDLRKITHQLENGIQNDFFGTYLSSKPSKFMNTVTIEEPKDNQRLIKKFKMHKALNEAKRRIDTEIISIDMNMKLFINPKTNDKDWHVELI